MQALGHAGGAHQLGGGVPHSREYLAVHLTLPPHQLQGGLGVVRGRCLKYWLIVELFVSPIETVASFYSLCIEF